MKNITNIGLSDALQQTLVNPTASFRWHALLEHYRMESNAIWRESVEQCLLAQVNDDGLEGFLRATFLAAATRNAKYSARAGQILQTITPLDPERIMAFSIYEWGREVTRGGSRSYFVEALRAACLPELMARAGHNIPTPSPIPMPVNPQKIAGTKVRKKIALVTPYLTNGTHPPTLLAFEHASLLQQMGLEVQVFSCQDSKIDQMPLYLGNHANLIMEPPNLGALKQLIPNGIKVSLGDERYSVPRRWHDILLSINQFDPDVVFFVGFISPAIFPLYKTRPVLGLCTHATPPMVPVDVWLTSDMALAKLSTSQWGDSIPAALGHFHPNRIKLRPFTGTITRTELGFTPEDLVLISAGARLEQEISGEWAEQMVGLLHEYPQVRWLLAGGQGVTPPALASVPKQQLKVLPHQTKLRGILGLCDVYLNPDRVGGGFSVAEAMAEGLPSLALRDSDGGDKVNADAAQNIAHYFEQLRALLADSALRRQMGARQQAYFAQYLNMEKGGASLLEAIEKTRKSFQQRVLTNTQHPCASSAIS